MIRFIVGLLVVFGAVGGMEDPANALLPNVAIAIVGLALMYFGTNKLNKVYA
jgi:hypothetical protein